MTETATVQAPVQPLVPSLKLIALPEIAVKLALGASVRRQGDQASVRFEQDTIIMHEEDFVFTVRVAERLRKMFDPSRLTRGGLIQVVGLAQKYVAEQLFRPGAVRVLYYATLSKVSAFYRCLMPMYALNMGGRAVAHASSARFGREAIDYDVVVVQIDNSPSALEFVLALQSQGKKVVYEIDDAFDCLEPWHPQYASYGQPARQEAIRAMLAQADAVQVSTRWLAARYADCAKRIEIVPNMVELAAWPRAERLRRDGLWKVLWAGSPSHSGDLEVAIPALGRFARTHPDVRIVFFGQTVKDERLPDGQVETIDWCEFEDYPFRFSSIDADVAIAPLAPIDFNKGKSNLRILQNWATGYPTVASDFGPYAETIKNGVDGLLCDTEDSWLAALETLYDNGPVCKRISDAGFEAVKAYDVLVNSKKIEAFYSSLVDRR